MARLLKAAAPALFLIWIWIQVALAQSPQVLDQAGSWTKVFSSGVMAYSTNDGAGSFIEFGCDIARSLDGGEHVIALEIEGKPLPPRSRVTFSADGETITIPSDRSGGISVSRCSECKNKLRQLWMLMRKGCELEVVGSDGRRATFKLNGTAKLMPVEVCADDVSG